jgi:hypothetical protein
MQGGDRRGALAGVEGISLSRPASPSPSEARGRPDAPDEYGKTSFVSLLLYVLGFMAALGALAFLAVLLLRA